MAGRRSERNSSDRVAWSNLRRAFRQNRSRLRSLPNVDHLGIGTKKVRGKFTNLPAIIVYVKIKQMVARKDRIPKRVKYVSRSGTIGWVPTDVVRLRGKPVLFGLRSGDLLRAFDGDQGTTTFAFSANNRKYAVTCAHVVLALARGGQSGPVTWIEWDTAKQLGVGSVVRSTSFDAAKITADAALVEFNQEVDADSWQILRTNFTIKKIGRLKFDDSLEYFYVAGGEVVKCWRPVGIPTEESVRVDVDGMTFRYSDFWKIPVTDGQPKPGHSGALILRVDGDGYVAAGVLFGGNELKKGVPPEAWAFSARKIWDVLRIDEIVGQNNFSGI